MIQRVTDLFNQRSIRSGTALPDLQEDVVQVVSHGLSRLLLFEAVAVEETLVIGMQGKPHYPDEIHRLEGKSFRALTELSLDGEG